MEFKAVTDYQQAHDIFVQASTTNEFNSKNYTSDQFSKGWDRWLGFYVLFDGDQPLAFSAIRDYGEYARIFDRYFVSPTIRKTGLGDNEFCKLMVHRLCAQTQGRIPFFSMEFAKRRRVFTNAVNVCNTAMDADQQFDLLPGLYETAPDSWQNVAIQRPHTQINLNFRSIR